MNLRKYLGGLTGDDTPPAPEDASADDVAQYTRKWQQHHGPMVDRGPDRSDPTMTLPFAEKQLGENVTQKTQYPWLYAPERGVRWDFDPVSLRNLAQENTWVGMLVQSITKEVAETPWTIARSDDTTEQRKRLTTHPEQRTMLSKSGVDELPDSTAEEIADLLMSPNPDHGWHDSVEMWLGDLLEVGSSTVVKAFPSSAYSGEGTDAQLARDADEVRPRALQTSAPEVWTKGYEGKTGVLNAFWQFDRERSPGSGDTGGGTTGSRGFRSPIRFKPGEVMWTDMTPRSNRRYGMPPTLLVEDFLRSLDLAVTQEQQYLSRGSIPSGAWVFEEWDRNEVKEWKTENEENIKGKPHKSLMFAGRGGDVRFEAMSMNFSELEFTERMKWYARVVSSVFQVPTAVVGIEPEKVNYNTFQGERENFEENTLGPYLQKLERFVNDELIRPHWGDGYHFEFKPGVSESTRGMISERVRSEWNANLMERSEAYQQLGREMPEDAEDGYKSDVVDEPEGDGGLFDNVEMSVTQDEPTVSKQDGFKADVFRVVLADDADASDFEDDVVGIGVDFPNDAVYVDWRNEVFPDELDNSHVSIYGTIEDLEQATGNVAEPIDSLDAVDAVEMAASVVKSADPGENPHIPDDYNPDGGGSGNPNRAVSKDEPLRETDEWYQFDVQPHMIESLRADIADDVQELFDRVLSDEQVQQAIERLATEDDDTAEKSLGSLSRAVREIIEQTRLSGDVADAIREHGARAIRETLDDTLDEVEDAPADDVDVERVVSRLRDRDVGFADRYADDLAAEIRDTVGEGYAEGKNSFEIQDAISDLGDIEQGWNGAEKIARQELQVATGEARSEVAAELDKVEVWEDSGDDRVRPPHASMDGLWKRPGENWVVDYSVVGRGVQKESVPGDSEPGIGCRCVTLLRDREEVDDADYAGDSGLN